MLQSFHTKGIFANWKGSKVDIWRVKRVERDVLEAAEWKMDSRPAKCNPHWERG